MLCKLSLLWLQFVQLAGSKGFQGKFVTVGLEQGRGNCHRQEVLDTQGTQCGEQLQREIATEWVQVVLGETTAPVFSTVSQGPRGPSHTGEGTEAAGVAR